MQVAEPQDTPVSGHLLPWLLGRLLVPSAEEERQEPEYQELTRGAQNLKALPSPVSFLLVSPSFTRASLSDKIGILHGGEALDWPHLCSSHKGELHSHPGEDSDWPCLGPVIWTNHLCQDRRSSGAICACSPQKAEPETTWLQMLNLEGDAGSRSEQGKTGGEKGSQG